MNMMTVKSYDFEGYEDNENFDPDQADACSAQDNFDDEQQCETEQVLESPAKKSRKRRKAPFSNH